MSDTGGGSLPPLKGKVTIDYNDLEKFLGKVEQTTKQSDTHMRRLGEGFKSAGDKVSIFAGLPIGAALLYATKSASDLTESMNVTKVTFGAAGGEVEKFVKTSASIGLSERAARTATGTFGGLLQNLGYTGAEAANTSISLTKLASDLGSVFNREPVEAAEALAAAIRGETEPIRAFNVSIDDMSVRQKAVQLGLAKSTAEVDKHSKAVGAVALITEQTSRYQNDFANTADGLANKTRILKAEIENQAAALGTKLLPAALSAAKGVGSLVTIFSELSDTEQYAILGIAAFLVALGPALRLIGNVTVAVNALTVAYGRMGAASFATNIGGLGAVGAALVVVGYQSLQALNQYEQFKAGINKELKTSNIESLKSAFNDTRAEAVRLQGELDKVQNTFNIGMAIAFDKAAGDAVKARKAYEDTRDVLDQVSRATGQNAVETQALADRFGVDLSNGVREAALKLIDQNTVLGSTSLATQNAETANSKLGQTVQGTTQAFDAFKGALQESFGVLITADEQQARLASGALQLKAAHDAAKGSLDLNTEAGNRYFVSLVGQADQIVKTTLAEAQAGSISQLSAGQKQKMIDRLMEMQRQYPETRNKVQEYIDKIRGIPDSAQTQVSLPGITVAQAQLDRLRAGVDAFRRQNPNFMGPVTPEQGDAAQQRGAFMGPVAVRASGGEMSPGNWYRVGERGPETMYLGASSPPAYVNKAESNAANGPGPTNVEVQVIFNGVEGAEDVRRRLPELTDAIKAGVGGRH